MAFAQPTWCESLRDIEAILGASSSKIYGMGFREAVRRTTLAYANKRRCSLPCQVDSEGAHPVGSSGRNPSVYLRFRRRGARFARVGARSVLYHGAQKEIKYALSRSTILS